MGVQNEVQAERGFTLIELMIVVAIVSVVSAIAMPQLLAARITANEANAAETLRVIAAAQAQIHSQVAIDTNGDGAGEYGYLEELAGGAPLRIAAGALPSAGTPGADELVPAPLTAPFRDVQNSVVSRSGYVFQVWLPATPALGVAAGIAEDPTGGKLAAPFPHPTVGSVAWCAYAWPMERGATGMPVYFVSNAGDILQYNNRGATNYSGLAGGPSFDAAYTVAGNMLSPHASATMPAADGNLWTLLR